uniref:Tetratricopeptide TPR_4 n=1 Tax=Solibacter usitatus (strain Ellin6076) TaxID=234267 RepID=Q026X7_SOLUE
MTSGRRAIPVFLICMPLAAQGSAGYIGSPGCRGCHTSQFASQSKSEHARALRKSLPTDPGPGAKAQWAFGAGAKAITWVSQTGGNSIAEHGLTYYAATKSLAVTPGHKTTADLVYRTFDPAASALLCFRCHSTGPIALATKFQVQPGEPGVHCEACHGPGRAHAESSGAAPIQNPKQLSAVQINILCGSCHRQASDLDDDRDWSNAWNVRHEPSYLHRAACFRNSNGALSCLTCHDSHQPLQTAASAYDAKCSGCHQKAAHTTAVAGRSCVACHMPQVAARANLRFTNHWIGVYDLNGRRLIPTRRVVPGVQPASARSDEADGMIVPADASTLIPVYRKAVEEGEPRADSNLGLFLLRIGRNAEAEAPLRRAVALDEQNHDPAIEADREGLGLSLDIQGKRNEAIDVFRRATAGTDPRVAARASVKLAALDPEHAEEYYRNAVAAEEKGSGAGSPRVAVVLYAYARELRARNRDREAEPLLRRALSIQQAAPESDPRVTIDVLNALGNLVEGRRQLDEAEKLIRAAMALAEEKFGPESTQLATSCTYLADVLWNRKSLRAAGLLFRRAITINASLYGPDRPETAADIANLGMVMTEAGQSEAGAALLRQALAIYENTLGPNSEEARFVRGNLAKQDE